jgi:hypothetical protein
VLSPRSLSLAALVLAAACAPGAPAPAERVSPAKDAGEDAADAAAPEGADAADAAVDADDAADASDGGEEAPRLGSIGLTTWIYAGRARQNRLGDVRPGTSVPLLRDEPVEVPPREHNGCDSGRWYEVAPRGWICEDETITRDLDAPLFRALAFAGPRDGAEPFQWAYSTRAPMYGRIPTEKEQRKAERRMRPVAELDKLRRSTAGHEDLAERTPPAPTGPLPDFLADHRDAPLPVNVRGGLMRKVIPEGSMLSYNHAFAVEGRTFLLSPDMTLVPADRVRPFRPSAFHGIAIDEKNPLPIGWFRKEPRPRFRRGEQGTLVETAERFAPRSFVGLTGKTVEQDGKTYWETREPGVFALADRYFSVVTEPEELPRAVDPDEKWIDVSLGAGTLTLFEGKRAVYATLMSPGAGGVTESPKFTVEELTGRALTPLGAYRIATKYRAAQLTDEATPNPESFWIADVPWVQYFRPPFAIHTAYWHEDFGMPKSGGCVNLAPADARFVFEWTEPRLPEGWGSVIARKDARGTWIVLRK